MPTVISAVRAGTLVLSLLLSSASIAQAQVDLLPLGATYQYLISPPGSGPPPGAEDPGFDDSAFSTGAAPFGLNIQGGISWAFGEVLIARRHLNLSSSPTGAVLRLKLQGAGSFYINGVLICELRNCAGNANVDQTLPLCDEILHAGDNVFAAICTATGVGIYNGSYFDATITTDPTVTAVQESTPNGGLALLRQNEPNPFAGSTSIRFSLGSLEKVTLKVFDVSGRELRTLADGIYAKGGHVLRWDGKDSSGSAVSSGVYFFEFRTRDFTKRGKMVVAR
jgi:FlgD Ig-like domain